jgi:hypothetical protein
MNNKVFGLPSYRRQIIRFFGAALACLLGVGGYPQQVSGQESAQERGYETNITARGGVDIPLPLSTFADSYKTGFGGNLELVYPFNENVDVGASGSIQRHVFDNSSLGEDVSVDGREAWVADLFAKVRLRPSPFGYEREYVPYVFGGIGASNIDVTEGKIDDRQVDSETQSGLGLTGGIGVRFLGGAIVEVKYTRGQTEGDPIEYLTISFGTILASQ